MIALLIHPIIAKASTCMIKWFEFGINLFVLKPGFIEMLVAMSSGAQHWGKRSMASQMFVAMSSVAQHWAKKSMASKMFVAMSSDPQLRGKRSMASHLFKSMYCYSSFYPDTKYLVIQLAIRTYFNQA